MAKCVVNKTYSNGRVFFDEELEEWIIEEVKKEEVRQYSLTKLLEELVACEDVSLSVKTGSEIEQM
ncbi:MAG: hypothetical protein RSA51_07335 [Niameybacter sp.]